MWKSGFEAAKNSNPLRTPFLRQFFYDPAGLMMTDDMFQALDEQVAQYGLRTEFNVRQYLISRGEVLATLAVSKAEETNLLKENDAIAIQRRLNENPDYNPMADSDVNNEKERHDRIETANIMRVYRQVSAAGIRADDLTVDLLKDLHERLSRDLDSFSYIPQFLPYRSGKLRITPIEIGGIEGVYKPVDYGSIPENLEELLTFYRQHPSLTNLNLLIIALYAIHPFQNGNKRVCRILEHALLRNLGMNQYNTYSHIYYYHTQIARFKDSVLRSLAERNFVPSMNLSREALFFSQLSVFKFGMQTKRRKLAKEAGTKHYQVFKHLVKHKELRYLDLRKVSGKMSEATFAKILGEGVERSILRRVRQGKTVAYSLNLDLQEEALAREVIESQKNQLSFIPENYIATFYGAKI